MRALKIVTVVTLAIALQGCGTSWWRGTKPKKQKRPITIVLVPNGSGGCKAKFSGNATHAYPGDTIIWEFVNGCVDKGSPRQLKLDIKSHSGNPFAGPTPPWNNSVDAATMAEIDLEIEESTSPGEYSFDIFVDNVPFDPKLEIDPYR